MFVQYNSLANLPFFNGLSAEDAKALAPHTRVKDYDRKQTLFLAGDPASSLYLVMGGRIKLYLQHDAAQTVIRTVGRGDIIGLIPLFEDPPLYPFCAEVLVRASAMEIDMGAAKRALGASPGFLNKVIKAITNEARISLETRHVLALPAVRRVGWLLLRLSSAMVGKGGTFRFPYDKGAAAAELCMSAETFSRALTQLRCAGVSCRDGQITIDDFQALRQFVESAAAPSQENTRPFEPQIEFDYGRHAARSGTGFGKQA